MQGVERVDRELLDAGALVGHLVAGGGMFAFLAAHRQDLFADAEFEDLFPSGRGRPSIPASVMASILVLQTLHDLSDRETAEAARCDLRWKVATGMALDHNGFDPSTLVYWRRRLAKSTRPQRINEAVRQVVEETGILRGRGKRAVDSTIVADAVATQDTITQLISAIRRVRRSVPGAAEVIAAVCTAHDYSRPGKPVIDWDEPGAKDTLVSALVNDANALLAVFAEVDQDVLAESAGAGLALLALVAGQDVEPAEGSDGTDGRWRIAGRVAPDRVISTVDPDARHTRKSPGARRDGYRAHVAAEPETGIITDEALTKAAGTQNSDPGVAEKFLAADEPLADEAAEDGAGEGGTREWYGDSAYGTGDLRGAIDDAGHDAVINPNRWPRPWRVGSPLTTSPSTTTRARWAARPVTPARSAGPGWPASVRCAAGARCMSGAPRPRPAVKSFCTNETTCSAKPAATGPTHPNCGRSTASSGPTWNGSSAKSPAAVAAA